MKAVILVGGFGTRLRPFTFTHPKPLVPFCNMPIVEHQIKALAGVGVNHIILAVGHMEDTMVKGMKPLEEKYNVKLTFSVEEEPLGTGGPLGLCREILTETNDPFFMLNSDVACEFPLADMLVFHKSHGKQGTILTTPVEDPSKYGLVLFDKETGQISQFLEKPPVASSYPSDKINAGIYILQPKVLDLVPLPNPKHHNISIERQIFPELVHQKSLFSYVLPGYWMDVGQPKDFLKGTVLHLKSLKNHNSEELAKGDNIKGSVLIHPTAQVSPDAVLGPDVVIGPNCVIKANVRIASSTIMEGTKVESGSVIKNTIVGWNSVIKQWGHLEGCFLGEDVTVAPEVVLIDTIVCPHKGSGANSLSASIQL